MKKYFVIFALLLMFSNVFADCPYAGVKTNLFKIVTCTKNTITEFTDANGNKYSATSYIFTVKMLKDVKPHKLYSSFMTWFLYNKPWTDKRFIDFSGNVFITDLKADFFATYYSINGKPLTFHEYVKKYGCNPNNPSKLSVCK